MRVHIISLQVVLLSVVLLSGCHGQAKMNKIMDSWIGASQSSLLEKWGPPSSKIQDGDAEVWTYTYDRSSTTTTKSPAIVANAGTVGKPVPVIFGGDSTSETTHSQIWRMFWFRDGKVVKWSYKGY